MDSPDEMLPLVARDHRWLIAVCSGLAIFWGLAIYGLYDWLH